MTYANCDVTS